MLILNFSHPLTANQLAKTETLTKRMVEQIVDIPVQFDNDKPFCVQVRNLIDQIPLTPKELQTQPLLVNLPSLNTITALVLAELHGRMGYFPPILRIRPIAGSSPTEYEVAEIINLQDARDDARKER
jgi:hypothetical protein